MRDSKISTSFWIKLVSVPVLMFAFAYAMVPLYDVLCDITGLNGKTGNISNEQVNFTIDDSRLVSINFLANTANGFPVDFKPEISRMEIVPGKVYSVNYLARNTSEQKIIGQAIPSVSPQKAALNFKKIECFCFDKQTFLPKQLATMPVRFVVSPELDKSVEEITLSYQFFKLNNQGESDGSS